MHQAVIRVAFSRSADAPKFSSKIVFLAFFAPKTLGCVYSMGRAWLKSLQKLNALTLAFAHVHMTSVAGPACASNSSTLFAVWRQCVCGVRCVSKSRLFACKSMRRQLTYHFEPSDSMIPPVFGKLKS
eukprot:6186037-Pleurochrysis_carterae.AAC.6